MADGKTDWGTLRGYWEADWLGTGITSNNNQSNSYVLRQRVIWGQAALNNGWAFTGGQLWSLATEDRTGISNLSGDIMLRRPSTRTITRASSGPVSTASAPPTPHHKLRSASRLKIRRCSGRAARSPSTPA